MFALILFFVGVGLMAASYYNWRRVLRLWGFGDFIYNNLGRTTMRLLFGGVGLYLVFTQVQGAVSAVLGIAVVLAVTALALWGLYLFSRRESAPTIVPTRLLQKEKPTESHKSHSNGTIDLIYDERESE